MSSRIMACVTGPFSHGAFVNMDEQAIQRRIVELQVEHGDLDDVIDRLTALAGHDELQLRRLKKRKLQIKDQILQLQVQLVPDIPA